MNVPPICSRILLTVGCVAMLVGAIDPLEGSVLILPGSALVALGTWVSPGDRRFLPYRLWVFVLVALGVGAMWGLSVVGGFGGATGRSMWWGMLVLPYLAGWSLGIWGPGLARWVPWLGIGVSLWYLVLSAILWKSGSGDGSFRMDVASFHKWVSSPGVVIAILGVVTIGGCVYRIGKRTA